MVATLDDTTAIDHQHLIRGTDSAQPVGDHKGCASIHQLEQRFLDEHFGARVNAAGGLVQDQERLPCRGCRPRG